MANKDKGKGHGIKNQAAQVIKAPTQIQGTQKGANVITGKDLRTGTGK